LYLLAGLFNFIFEIFLNSNHPKVKNLAKFVNELRDIFIRDNLIQVFKNNRLDRDIAIFFDNLKNIASKHQNILRDYNIELFMVQMECIDDFLEKGTFKLLTHELNITPIQKSSKKISRILFQKELFYITHPIEFSINNTGDKKYKNSIQTEYSDLFDEYAILSIMEHSVNDPYKLKKIISWRKRIIEIAKSNGLLVAKILSANTIRKLEIDDFDIIEVFAI
jgi:hypothetical protein